VVHIKWFRDRADHDRFREEVQILQVDHCVPQCMTEVWTQLAHKKAEMYDGLAQECSKAYEVARKAAGSINAGVKQ